MVVHSSRTFVVAANDIALFNRYAYWILLTVSVPVFFGDRSTAFCVAPASVSPASGRITGTD